MDYRLFAALDIPDEIAEELRALQRGIDGAGWRPRENFHLTLRFFGSTDGAKARDLDAELAQFSTAPFEIQLKGVGSFGGYDPHSIWADVVASEALKELAKSCDKAARRCGFKADKRGFRPHVTLAYLKGISPETVAAWLTRFAMFEAAPFWVDSFALYSSWPGRYASRYQEEASYPLYG